LNRKLLILDVVLVAALAWAGFQFHDQWRASQARQSATLNHRIAPVPPPQFTPLPPTPGVLASSYGAIADKMLFDRSRNATVVVEVPPPPPPKPMPPLPVYHGMMNLGDGTVAVMSVNASAPHQEVRPGEAIGPFKLVDVTNEEITLEWDGKTIHKHADEMSDRASREAPQTTQAQTAQAAQAAPAAPANATPLGPGDDGGRGFRGCQPNDSSPTGTVMDGYRKTSTFTLFGQQCRWEPVGKQ
jgi:hypothetical protein